MPMRLRADLPALTGATQWLHTAAVDAPPADLEGHAVLVHFWSVSCPLCKGNLPAVHKIRDDYAERGLRVVAIHMPRGDVDLDIPTAIAVAAEHGITEPIAIDNAHVITDAFEATFVPAYYLFDAEHKMRGRSGGANGPTMIRTPLDKLFPEPKPDGADS